MASLTTDEPSSFPTIAQETGQVHTVSWKPPHRPVSYSCFRLSRTELCSLFGGVWLYEQNPVAGGQPGAGES